MIKQTVFLLTLQLLFLSALSQHKIETIPDPKSQGQDHYVSDPDGILGYAVDSLNSICAAIDEKSSAEVAIVVVDDFEGSSDFDFAYQLFNHWGIGKAANDNGLLLFIAKDRRAYQFITGYGMEGSLPDVTLGAVGERHLVPKFKEGDYGGGVIDAMNAIQQILQHPEAVKELKSAVRKTSFWDKHQATLLAALLMLFILIVVYIWMGTTSKRLQLEKKNPSAPIISAFGCLFFIGFASIFVIGFLGIKASDIYSMQTLPWIVALIANIILFAKYEQGRSAIIHSYKDEENIVNKLSDYNKQMALPMLLTPLSFFFLIGYFKRKSQLKQRLQPPDVSGKWIRLNRDNIRGISAYLDEGQQKEETLKAMSYEIWQHADNADIKIIKWNGSKFKKYEDCPKCQYHTLNKVYVKTLKAATYTSSGTGEKIQDCNCCDYHQSFGTVVLPKKVKSTSSGSSGGSSGSSSSSGNWGGGRSGGGGAGGRW